MYDNSDIALLARMRADDETAFAKLYQRYWEDCYRVACKMIYLEDVAQDVVQEVFFKVWERRHEQEITAVKPYLLQATRNRVLNAIRDRKTDQRFFDRLAEVTIDLLQENHALLRENEQLLNLLIDTLPDDCRETFRLSRQQHLTYKEIALQLQVSEKTVEKRISKSMQLFRKKYHLIGIYAAYIVLSYIRE
ncbi:RNA polymerase sigma-70 factor, ECF subfamily [Chitinophaga eiseniae]|uniref:RNA polymerase sigma-70 factor, ECF subfamily n=1 Tax=Chitinophaga eiseniae TaxID=634771 RepID=A0A1T4TBE3_9BACT|nr:RNA polymerase sigma-70 factor [Chitinophaga eiseniae]SKA37651.1 RNA polymerase sigma-70 factor, ECF subfamily [Chitinophaga eiseniae]